MKISITDRRQLLDAAEKGLVERRLRFALSRFTAELQRVEAVFDDENGPRGGIDKGVRCTAWLQSGSVLNVSHQDSSAVAAATMAAARLSRLMARALGRARMQRMGVKQTRVSS